MRSPSGRRSTQALEGRFEEVVVRLFPARSSSPAARRSSQGEATRTYDALIYSNMELDGLGPAPPYYVEQYGQLDNLGLVAVEHITVRWSRYHEYLDAFVEGDKAAYYLRSQLIKTLSSGLENFFGCEFPTPKPVRVWWSSETPELDDLPWELIAHAGRGGGPSRLSFVRGLPGEVAPLVPIEGPRPRLAFIHEPDRTPRGLSDALSNLSGVEVVPMTGSLRAELHRAVRDKFELVHIVADGSVSLAYEGILEFGGKSERLAPSEICSLLLGSRVTILGLTPNLPPPSEADSSPVVLTTYRSFVCLGTSRQVLPTIVSPLGPMSDGQQHDFWRDFYETLATALSVEDAVEHAHNSTPWAAVALFLRHRLGREFVRRVSTHGFESASRQGDPTAINADLQVARSFLEDLRAVDSKYAAFADNVTDSELATAESARQDHLDGLLETWRDLAEEEK